MCVYFSIHCRGGGSFGVILDRWPSTSNCSLNRASTTVLPEALQSRAWLSGWKDAVLANEMHPGFGVRRSWRCTMGGVSERQKGDGLSGGGACLPQRIA